MYRTFIIPLITAVGVSLSAQTIAIKGKVTNAGGKGISGASITLTSQNLSTTTDDSGNYTLAGATAVTTPAPALGGARVAILKNSNLVVELTESAPVRIELFDIKGNLMRNVFDKPASIGSYQFNLTTKPLATNMMVIRVTIGSHSSTFRYFPFGNNSHERSWSIPQSGNTLLAKLHITSDSLQASAQGYTAKTVKIASYDTTIDIALDTADCKSTASQSGNATVTGSGPHKVIIETNPDPGISAGTIYRPTDMGPGKKYPIFAWGEGACSQNGLSNKAAMGEIASWGYFVVADGKANGSTGSNGGTADALLAYITWAIAENGNPCSAYYQSLDTTAIAVDGFSCGGLMAENAAGDPRLTAVGITSSGLFNEDQAVYQKIHTPFKILLGGSVDMAYANGIRDYDKISALDIPILLLSKNGANHGGDLGNGKGDFNTVNLAWLNWQLKGDMGETGKGLLVGPNCKFCTLSSWEYKTSNLP